MRRWLIVGAVSLMLGLLLNIGVAMGLAWFLGQHSWTMRANQSNLRDAGIAWPEPAPEGWPVAPGGINRFEGWACRLDSYGSSKVTDRVVPQGTPVEIRIFQQNVWYWGWPMRSLKMTWQQAEVPIPGSGGGYRQVVPDRTSLGTGLLLPARMWREPIASVLPLMPIWGGFTINTLIYGCVAGALLFGPRALRQHLRRRRGLCLGCGYDLAGLARCSECGKAAESNRRPSNPARVT